MQPMLPAEGMCLFSGESPMKQTLIDLFSGCGGVTQGFKNQGYQTLAAVEWDSAIAQTYKLNHPDVLLYENDIRKVDPAEVFSQLKLEVGELTVLSACAPCQPFSRQNKALKEDDRTKLILEVLPFVRVFRPQYVVMENVPGLIKGKNKTILDELISSLRDEYHYKVFGPYIVDAVNYGIPQFRKRLILLCSRDDIELSLPPTTHASPEEANEQGKKNWRTVGDAFTGIPKLASGQKCKTDPMHQARKHTPLNLERLSYIPKNGGSRRDLPERLQLACHKNKKDVGYNDVYGRMDFGEPANTLTTGCTNITKGRYAHPTANRAITLREAARLQTFSDSYKFNGGYDQITVQIGNAVPVLLAEVFAKYLIEISTINKS
jgi:DNA (cytosine-5)-methyltransferase 1